ncbi:MAG: MFS transporter [Caldisericia bacterium]|nr:MFS transporter [Caldisericia bacterium]
MTSGRIKFNPVLILLYTLSGVICAFAFQTCIAPVIDQVAQTNNLSFFLRTIIMSAPSLGSMAFLIPSGKMLDKGNPVRLSLPFLSAALILSILSIFTTNTVWMLVLRLCAGLAFAPLYIYGIQIISLVAPPQSKNTLSTIQTLGAPMAYLLTSLLSSVITINLGFNFTYLIPIPFAIIGIVGSVYYWNLELPERKTQTQTRGWLSKESLVLAACWFLFSMCTSVFIFLGPNMARTLYNFSPIAAGFTNLTFAIPAMIVGFIIGSFVDKKVKRFTLISYPSLILGILIFSTSLGRIPFIVSIFIMGFAASLIPPMIFTTPPRIEPPSKIAQSISFINMAGTFAMLISSPIAGLLKDTLQSWVAPFAYAGLMGISIFFVALTIKRSLS